MIRYRSASTAPGVKPPDWIESEEASLPTRDDVGGRCALCAMDGDATFVGSWDTDDTASPHDAQNRAASETPDPHLGQAIKMRGFYRRAAAATATSERACAAAPPA
jgi:hypothetical protein